MPLGYVNRALHKHGLLVGAGVFVEVAHPREVAHGWVTLWITRRFVSSCGQLLWASRRLLGQRIVVVIVVIVERRIRAR